MVKIKSPFINENDDFGILSVMLNLRDFEISHPLNDLYYLLMNQHPDKYNNLHITLFKMFFNFKHFKCFTHPSTQIYQPWRVNKLKLKHKNKQT